MSIVERIAYAWDFAAGIWSLTPIGKPVVGFIRVTEGGAFQARYQAKWLSSSRYIDFHPFETLHEAKEALIAAWVAA